MALRTNMQAIQFNEYSSASKYKKKLNDYYCGCTGQEKTSTFYDMPALVSGGGVTNTRTPDLSKDIKESVVSKIIVYKVHNNAKQNYVLGIT